MGTERGFEVAAVDGHGESEQYRLRRISDGQVLPEPFDPGEPRREPTAGR